MWDLPGSGMEPLSPALAGGFFTTEPPGQPWMHIWWTKRTKIWVHSCCNSCLKTPSWTLKPSCSSLWRKWTVTLIPRSGFGFWKKLRAIRKQNCQEKHWPDQRSPLALPVRRPEKERKVYPVVLAACWWGSVQKRRPAGISAVSSLENHFKGKASICVCGFFLAHFASIRLRTLIIKLPFARTTVLWLAIPYCINIGCSALSVPPPKSMGYTKHAFTRNVYKPAFGSKGKSDKVQFAVMFLLLSLQGSAHGRASGIFWHVIPDVFAIGSCRDCQLEAHGSLPLTEPALSHSAS